MAMRIYTKTGDKGMTGLYGGERVRKDDVRVEAYGAVDELSALLGAALSDDDGDFGEGLKRIQSLLFELGGELATPKAEKKAAMGVRAEDTAWLENEIDKAEEGLPPLKSFILPGGTRPASSLHHARTVCRRAERRVVTLREIADDVSEESVRFLNRLADLLFVWARRANFNAGVDDIPWVARGT